MGAAGDNPSPNGIENGNGLGLGNTPPGQLKKFESFASSFEQSPDDFYENDYESSIDGVFEVNFDGTQKGNGEGKGQFGAVPQRTGIAPGSLIADEKSNGKKPFCAGKGIGGIPVILLNGPSTVSIAKDETYNEQGARACDRGIDEITNLIIIGGSVNTSVDGVYTITYDVTSPNPPGNSANTVSRTVIVGEVSPTFEVLDGNGNVRVSDFNTNIDSTANPPSLRQYDIGTIQNIVDDGTTDGGVIVDASGIDGTKPSVGTYTVTYSVTDNNSNTTTITETVNVCAGGCGGGGNVPPTASASATTPINENTSTLLDGTADDPDGDNSKMTFLWEIKSGIGGSITNATSEDATFNAPNIAGGGPNRVFTITLTVTDELGAQTVSNTITITVVNSG